MFHLLPVILRFFAGLHCTQVLRLTARAGGDSDLDPSFQAHSFMLHRAF